MRPSGKLLLSQDEEEGRYSTTIPRLQAVDDNPFQWNRFHPKHLIVSGFWGDTNVLMVVRAVLCLYFVGVFFAGLALTEWNNPTWVISHYIDLNYLCTTMYFLGGAVFSLRYRLRIGRQMLYDREDLEATHWERFQWILFEVTATNTYFLTSIYWYLIHDYSGPLNVYSICDHMLAPIFLTLELFLNKLDVPPIHVLISLPFTLFYVFFPLFWYWMTGVWLLAFLSSENSVRNAAILVTMVVLAIVYFYFLKALILLREKIVSFTEMKKQELSFEELKEWEGKTGSASFTSLAFTDEDDEFLTDPGRVT